MDEIYNNQLITGLYPTDLVRMISLSGVDVVKHKKGDF